MEFNEIVVKESPGLCRCCLSEGCYKDLGSEYTWMNEAEVYADMLLECFDISITQHNEGPNGPSRLICEVCITRLRDACNFKKQVLDSEKKFIDMLGRGEFRPKVLIYQTQMKTENSDEQVQEEVEYLEDDLDFDDDEVLKPSVDEHSSSPLETVTSETISLKRKLKTKKTKISRPKKHVEVDEKPKSSKAVSKDRIQPQIKRLMKTEDAVFEDKYKRPLKTVIKSPQTSKITILRSNAIAVLKNSTLMPFRWLKNVYRCFFCYDMFADTKDLKSHQEQHALGDNITKIMQNYWDPAVYVDITNITCKLCLTKHTDIDALIDHLIEEHKIQYNKEVKTFATFRLNLDTVDCLECRQSFRTFGHMLMHTKRCHKGNSEALCETCGKYFKNSIELKKHNKTVHDKKSVICRVCGVNVESFTRMRTHMERFHNKRYKCFYCDDMFPSHYKRSRHMLEVHKRKEKVKCTECDLSFVFRSSMMRHVRESHLRERNEICPLCGFQAFGKGRLSVHMKKHSDEREFSCNLCDKAFKTKKNLNQHIKNLHEKTNDPKNAILN